MSRAELEQVSRSPAEVYEEFFVPAILREWADRVAEAAAVEPGQRVLDVACGTGLVARRLQERVGPELEVVGIDASEPMLGVARRKAPSIDWRHARAEELPFDADVFDAVVSQFGLMFFDDRRRALQEMQRVLKPGGRLVVVVWDSIEHFQGYDQLADLFERYYGDAAAASLRAPFLLGDRRALASLFADAGVGDAAIATHDGFARFPSVADWLRAELHGWVGIEEGDDPRFEQLRRDAEQAFKRYVGQDGRVELRTRAHIVTAIEPLG